MPVTCAVASCKTTHLKESGIQLFHFPLKDVERCKKWTAAVERENWTPSKHSVICSKHFTADDYLDRPNTYIKRLKPDAVPSLLLPTAARVIPINNERASHFEHDIPAHSSTEHLQGSNTSNEVFIKEEPQDDIKTELGESSGTYFVFGLDSNPAVNSSDSSESINDVPAEKKIKVEMTPRKKKLKKKIKVLQQTVRRQRKKIETMAELIQELKNKGLVEKDVVSLLAHEFDGLPLKLFENEMNNKNRSSHGRRYSQDIKEFVLTLYYYSPKAYNYCRRIFKLPHPSSIRNWMQSVNAEPGFYKDVLKLLETFSIEDKDCSLIFDSMAIRKQRIWDPCTNSFKGYCDYGQGVSIECKTEEATEALVFFLVQLRGKWKWPIGHFFINKISVEVQTQLIKTILNMLSEVGIRVWNVTCDGTSTNLSTLERLGCKLRADNYDNMQTFFIHRQNKVYAILDACHMLKLARNCMAEHQELLSPTGSIKWSFITELHSLQKDLTLKFKNKLSSSCVNWRQNKMKVKFAAQTLSASVANAITFLNKSNIKEFNNSDATIEFIEIIDQIFDFLNSRNPFGKGYKKPIYAQNINYLKSIMETKINYLFLLRRTDDLLLCKSPRRTFILGFAASIKSVLSIAEEVLQERHFKYLLTYNFSQDFLEIFFSKIRSRHGHNNNPNVQQFRSAMRQILLKNAISASPNGNCNATENDPIGSIFPIVWSYKKGVAKLICDSGNEDELQEQLTPEAITLPECSELKNYILHYISGYIVRQIVKKINCDFCIRSLIDQKKIDHTYAYNSNFSRFTDDSNNGGLVSPSSSVLKIVLKTEQELLICTNNLQNVNIPNLLTKVLLNVKQHFAFDGTIFLTEQCDDHMERPHKLKLIVSVAHKFLTIRLFSFGKFYTDEVLLPLRRRHKLSKMILFSSE